MNGTHAGGEQAALSLFCFPPAGGNSSLFDAWSAELPDWIGVCPIQLPGRYERANAPLFVRLAPLVDLLVDEMLPQLIQPYALFGHSMGALIAFEVARALRASRARDPLALYVSGFGAPHLPYGRPSIHSLPDDGFVQALRPVAGGGWDGLDAELRQVFLPVLRADIELCESYRHMPDEPLSCPLRVFGGCDDESVAHEELAAWHEHTQGPFRLDMFPGDHSFPATARAAVIGVLRRDLVELAPLPLRWDDTARSNDAEPDVLARFDALAAARPTAVAFTDDTTTLTFAELGRRANQLAHYLADLGVGPEVPVGVCVERSCEVPAILLAVWKAGGAWLPLDPSYPPDRLRFMSQDAGAPVLVTTSRLAHLFPADGPVHTIWLDRDALAISECPPTDPGRRIVPDQLASITYTSGSTGEPKGVAVEHRQILNRLVWMWQAYPFAPDEVGAQITATSFVDSLWELLGPLLCGNPTVIVRHEQVSGVTGLVDTLAAAGATRLGLVPSLLRAVLDACPDLGERLPRLRFWMSTGEALPVELYQRFQRAMPHATLYNLYGTSEVWDATWYDPRVDGEPRHRVPIGRPIRNVQAYVLDQWRQPVPPGAAGELYVGGHGLARGYLGRPDLTAERFVADPFGPVPGGRLYRTGDRARHLPSGALEFLGRQDDQFNIRGFRVERGEVEARLGEHPAVREVAVTLTEAAAGGSRLIAHVVAEGRPGPAPDELRAYLAEQLPLHCVPNVFVPVEALPLTASGKVDYRRLQAGSDIRSSRASSFAAPQTELEHVVANLWSDALQEPRIGLHDDFFSRGGHSLLAAGLVLQLRDVFGVEFSLRRFFEAPTVAGVVTALVADPRTRAAVYAIAERCSRPLEELR